ncbi:FixH family protein [Bacillus sp. SCS-153A]|uniref:FixH family protein n=1 Tax=Rossellomorea sedimentorum TaxID=3115294 RepID=UPI0039059A4B
MKFNMLWMIITLSSALLLASCGANNEQNASGSGDTLEPVKVEVTTQPGKDELKEGEEFTIQAKVTQGDENVDDANEVEFEFWKKDEEQHEKLEGQSQGEGVYSISMKVDEPGIYYVISHVTARDMHTMPKLELAIGDSGHAHEEGHDHGEEVTGHIMMADNVKAGEDSELTGHAMSGEEPLTEADVRFEIWRDGEENHEYIDAAEISDGEYKSTYIFSEKGTYHVKLHIEKGELHTHTEKTIMVE